jgi:membrane protease YdiL (CAAX protease family)
MRWFPRRFATTSPSTPISTPDPRHPVVASLVVAAVLLWAMAVATLAGFGLAILDLGIPLAEFDVADGLTWIRSRLLVLGGLQWLAFVPTALWLGRWLGYDRTSLGLSALRPLNTAGAGLALGVALLLVPASLGRLLGGFEDAAPLFALPTWVAAAAILAVMAMGEEILFRGILLRIWRDRLGDRGALVLTTLLFAALHSGNPNVGVLGVLGVLLAGALLGLAALRSGGLWWPFGIHLGWNAAGGLLLGLPVSGLNLPSPVRWIPASESQSLWGGAFGPEAGVVFHTALLVGIVIVASAPFRVSGARSQPPAESPIVGL